MAFPEDYKRDIPNCYGTEPGKFLYFKNPACFGICLNIRDDGISGDRCNFTRQEVEKFRDQDLERSYDKLKDKPDGIGWCSLCSVSKHYVEAN